MKRILSLLLFLSLTAAQAEWPLVFPGAWWMTSNPGSNIQAGSMSMNFNEDGTIDAEFYLDNEWAADGVGSWRYTDKKQTRAAWTVIDGDGWTYAGTVTKGIAKGTIKHGKMRGQVLVTVYSVAN